MTLLALIAVALATGFATMLFGDRPRRRLSLLIGLAGSLIVLAIAFAMPHEESVVIGDIAIVVTPVVRAMTVAWSATVAVLSLIELGVGGRPTVVGPSLLGLAVAATALATRDAASSVAALAAGSVAGVVIPGLHGWLEGQTPARLATTQRGALAVLGSALIGLVAIAWGASPTGPLGSGADLGAAPANQVGIGLALLAIVAAVAIRCGLIPAHVWAARFMEGVSPLAIPAAFAWGSAAFVLAALDWSQVALTPDAAGGPERFLIISLGLVSVVLGGLAAMFHDDIEHVLGYSIVADAGVAVLAFASLEPAAAAAARNWLVASATVKTAFAAWCGVVRATYGGHRLADLGGWARHAPLLGLAFGGILVAAIGLPGMALFDARAGLISGSMPGFGSVLALIVTAMPAVYLGRIALAGVAPISSAVGGGPSGRPRRTRGRAAGWSGVPLRQALVALPAEARANRAPLMALGVMALSLMAVATSAGGAGG
ncbi:MAG TPA: proton-conducting transporter membrane subunit [Candidatus Limnocylindrales bacterium]|nr:proton-conducting transporter membrane subunit [Candidatus Limnocylindrales bacterium]